ncbi:MAG: hypothetical protein H5U10_08300 [Desulfacinum sp.]|nr:hypothetical protein [Desulfacinum sp.]
MTSAEQMESLVLAAEELRSDLQDLRDLACRNADAAAIHRATLRCKDAFSRLVDLASSLESEGPHRQVVNQELRGLLADLLDGYSACQEELARASGRIRTLLAGVRKTKSASKQYQKIAALG